MEWTNILEYWAANQKNWILVPPLLLANSMKITFLFWACFLSVKRGASTWLNNLVSHFSLTAHEHKCLPLNRKMTVFHRFLFKRNSVLPVTYGEVSSVGMPLTSGRAESKRASGRQFTLFVEIFFPHRDWIVWSPKATVWGRISPEGSKLCHHQSVPAEEAVTLGRQASRWAERKLVPICGLYFEYIFGSKDVVMWWQKGSKVGRLSTVDV